MGVSGLIGPGDGKVTLTSEAMSALGGDGGSAQEDVSSFESVLEGALGPDESPEEELSS